MHLVSDMEIYELSDDDEQMRGGASEKWALSQASRIELT